MNPRRLLLLSMLMISLTACETYPEQDGEAYKTDTVRTIILGSKEIQEDAPGDFVSWKCRDYPSGKTTLVEVGRLSLPDELKAPFVGEETQKGTELIDEIEKLLGFVLYDGTNSGELAFYTRSGLNHRWDWGDEPSYAITIKPDGTGLYYDFSTAIDGKKERADEVFKCSR